MRKPEIVVGNLDSIRDFTHVEDVTDAYVKLGSSNLNSNFEVFNVCSNKGIKIADIITVLSEVSGIKVEILEKSTKMRPSENPRVVGNNKKLSQYCDWYPTSSFKEIVEEVYNYYLDQLKT